MSKGTEIKKWIEEEVHKLARETDEAKKSERVKAYLEFCARFHRYSAHNNFWLMCQCLERGVNPTRFAGIKTWNAMNRRVKKGEKSFSVLAPVEREYTKEVTEEVVVRDPVSGEKLYDPDTGEPLTTQVKRYKTVKKLFFKSVPVYDLSQTEVMKGKEDGYLRLQEVIATGGDASMVLPLVMDLASTVKPVVEVDDLGGALGNTDYRLIRVLKSLEPATKVEVLLHETAHVVLEHNYRDKGVETREAEAAATAYVVAKYLGLEPGGDKYLALWSQEGKDVLKCMDRVLVAADQLISAASKIAGGGEAVACAAVPAPVEAPTRPERDSRVVPEIKEMDDEPVEATEPEERPKEASYDGTLVIEKKALKALLDQATRYIRRCAIPILSGIYFQAKDGKLQVSVSDLDTYVVIKAEARGEGALAFVADAKELKGIVKKLKGNSISICSRDAGDRIKVTDGKVTFEFVTMPEEDFPQRPEGKFSKLVETSVEEFKKLLGKVLPATSKDEMRSVLMGVLFDFEEGTLVATDSYRMAIVDTGWKAQDKRVLLPADPLRKFLKLKERAKKVLISIDEDETYTLLECGNTSMFFMCIEGKFPDYHRLIEGIEKKASIRMVVDAGELLDALESVDIVPTVRVRIDGQKVELGAETRERSASTRFTPKVVELIEVESDEGDEDRPEGPIEVAFNNDYMKDGLSSMEGDVEIYISPISETSANPSLFREGGFSYYLMPIRL